MLIYSEYTDYGGTLTQEEFNRYEYRSSTLINAHTFNRIKNETPVRETVKRLVFELVELLATYETGKPQISSVSADGVSESYVTMTSDEFSQKVDNLIIEYLSGEVKDNVPLLYLGVC